MLASWYTLHENVNLKWRAAILYSLIQCLLLISGFKGSGEKLYCQTCIFFLLTFFKTISLWSLYFFFFLFHFLFNLHFTLSLSLPFVTLLGVCSVAIEIDRLLVNLIDGFCTKRIVGRIYYPFSLLKTPTYSPTQPNLLLFLGWIWHQAWLAPSKFFKHSATS